MQSSMKCGCAIEQLTKNASEHIEAMRAQIEKIEKELKAMLDIVRLGTAPKMIRE